MAVVRVQTTDTGENINATGKTFTVGYSAPTQNNLLLLHVQVQDPTGLAITGITGWTLGDSATSGVHMATYWKIAGAGESITTTVTVTNNSHGGLCFQEYSGVDTSNPIDQCKAIFDASGTALSSPVALPQWLNGAAIYFFGTFNFAAATTLNLAQSLTTWTDGDVVSLASSGGLAPRVGIFSHRTLAADNRQIGGWVYDNVAPDTQSKMMGTSFTATSWSPRSGSILTLLKPASAVANTAVVSSAGGSGTMVQQRNNTWTTTTTVSPTLTNNTVVGNLLFCIFVCQNDAASVSAGAAGWTRFGSVLHTALATTEAVEVWYKICTATSDKTPGAFTLTGSSSGGISFYEFSGCSVADPTTNGLTPVNSIVNRSVLATSAAATAVWGPRSRTLVSADTLEVCFYTGQVSSGANEGTFPTAADNTWTAGVSPANGTRVTGLLAFKCSLGAGVLFVRGDQATAGAGAAWSSGALVSFAFQMRPAGADHWGWAEGSDSSDSWQMMPA